MENIIRQLVADGENMNRDGYYFLQVREILKKAAERKIHPTILGVFAVVTTGDKVLLVLKKGSDKYGFPGGAHRPGDDYYHSCEEEFLQELGVDLDTVGETIMPGFLVYDNVHSDLGSADIPGNAELTQCVHIVVQTTKEHIFSLGGTEGTDSDSELESYWWVNQEDLGILIQSGLVYPNVVWMSSVLGLV